MDTEQSIRNQMAQIKKQLTPTRTDSNDLMVLKRQLLSSKMKEMGERIKQIRLKAGYNTRTKTATAQTATPNQAATQSDGL
jgi:hypothetical protein